MKRRLALLLAAWLGILLAVIGGDLLLPTAWWGGILRAVIALAAVPASMWTGQYFLRGPRHARRWWLTFRFVAANWTRTRVIIERAGRTRQRMPGADRRFEAAMRRWAR